MDVKEIGLKYLEENKYQELEELLKDHKDSNDPLILYLLGSLYNKNREFSKAFTCFSRSASMGEPQGERALGIYYFLGNGTPVDTEKGFYYLKLAASHGLTLALCSLAHVYMNGIGVDKDEYQGYLYYLEASEKGNKHAIEHLIECYTKGIGIPIDLEKANELKKRL